MEKRKKIKINIFKHVPGFKIKANIFKLLVERIICAENILISELCIIFVDNPYLQNLHKQYLNNSANTDVITFNLGESGIIEGEIYISLEQAKLNAQIYSQSFYEEIARLIIHGMLHLMGFKDKKKDDQKIMRKLENRFLEKYWFNLTESRFTSKSTEKLKKLKK